MPVPSSSDIQFVPTGQAKFSVDSVTDPGGAPTEVLDVELGGPIDKRIGCTDFDITATPGEPNPKTYNWTITFPGNPPVLPDPATGSQLYRLAAVFLFGDQSTDIAAFVEMGMYLLN